MQRLFRPVCLAILIAALPFPAIAAGTAAGITISNSATLVYSIGITPQTNITSTATFVVDNKVNLTVTKVADAPAIASGSLKQALAFTVTNNGNAAQRYALSAVAGAATIASMTNVNVYLDANGDNVWDAGDTLYVNAGSFGDVAADASLKILIVADTPLASGGQTAIFNLLATTVNAGTLVPTTATAAADSANAVDVVFADIAGSAAGDIAADGRHSAFATFTISASALVVGMTKSIIGIQDASGCNATVCSVVAGTTPPVYQCLTGGGSACKIVPGSIVTYRVNFNVSGSGNVNSLAFTDPVPADLSYVPASIDVDGVAKTDAADGDNAAFCATVTTAPPCNVAAPNTVIVTPGNVTAPLTTAFTFRATVN